MAATYSQSQLEPAVMSYIESYLEFHDNIPATLSRMMTRIHEIDQERLKLVRTIENTMTKYNTLKTQETKCTTLNFLTSQLLELRDITDTKLNITQSFAEQIEMRKYQLDTDYRLASSSLNIGNSSNQNNSANANQLASTNGTNGPSNKNNQLSSNPAPNSYSVTHNNSTGGGSPATGKESRSDKDNGNSKRVSRRYQGSKKEHHLQNDSNNSGDDRSSTPVGNEKSGNGGGGSNNNHNNNKRASKRSNGKVSGKSDNKRSKNDQNDTGNETPDEDEPIYCSCRQVSFGEMIGCDNDQCEYEWFHFSCVSLSTKPKGKWYCPDCRGERSNIPRK